MLAVFKRELRSYLSSPVGYIYLFFYLIASGFVFYLMNVSVSSTAVNGYFGSCRYILIISIPILAMKLFPEERKNKTDQILITAPISITKMVLGKYVAAYLIFAISLVPSILNMWFLANGGYLEILTVIGNYVGLLMIGAAFLAISMLMSCITESMIVAYVMGVFVLAVFGVCDLISSSLNNTTFTQIVNVISITERLSEFTEGLFNLSTILYFISLMVIFLFLVIRVIDRRRYS